MNKWQWKVFSVTTILALALMMYPTRAVSADYVGDGTITGVIALAIPDLGLTVSAYPVGGSEHYCISDWVNFDTDHYDYSISGCDHTLNFKLVTEGNGYTFNEVSVLSADFTEIPPSSGNWLVEAPAVPDITPIDRAFSGIVTKPNGDPWVGFELRYDLDGGGVTTVTTDGSGVYSIPGVTDASTLYFPNQDEFYDGYSIGGDFTYYPPLSGDVTDNNFTSQGNRNIHGYVDNTSGNQACRIGVTMTVTGGSFSSAYTNDPSIDTDVMLDMSDTSGFKVGDSVTVSSSAGSESAAITVVNTNASITVDELTLDHTLPGQVTLPAPATQTKTALTDADGGFNLNNLEPVIYSVTPTKGNCAFTPTTQTVNIRNGNGRQPVAFKIPNSGVYGNVKTTLGDVSLAYYLIATYTTAEGTYSNAVNWANGGYWINAPPSTGTLTISRVGGPAAFGYEAAGSSRSVTIASDYKEENFLLTPSRNISGMIMGQNAVPVQKNATVDFGYGLKWTQANTPLSNFSLKAQPKLYYLSPVETGILSSLPVRMLVNLTALPASPTLVFNLNLKTYALEGCLRDFDGSDSLVLPTGSVRFRPAPFYGSVLYPATLALDGCGPNSYYYKVMLPKGIAGSMEADNHNLRGSTIDGMNWDTWREYRVFGNRSITGRIYAPNLNIDINSDFNGNGFLVLRDAATNDVVQTGGDLERSYEFSIPTLESKAYTVSINPEQIPDGYDAQPFPMSPIVTANLSAGDVDIPAASGFVLVHSPINPVSATGGGYFVAPITGIQKVIWNYPPMNNRDWDGFRGFDVQIAPATTAFTDIAPAPVFYGGDPAAFDPFTGLNPGTLFRWRVRAVYQNDKGPWMETAPLPTSPTVATYTSNVSPGAVAGPVTFDWNQVVPATGVSRRFTNNPGPAKSETVLYMNDTSGFTAGDYVVVSSWAGSETRLISVVDPDVSLTVDALTIDHATNGLVTVVADPAATPKLRYQVQYSDNTAFSAVLPGVAVTLTSVAGEGSVNTLSNPAIGKTFYWRVKAQYNTVATTWVDVSGWSPTQVFFNRYKNISDNPTWDYEDFGFTTINPIHFHAASLNTSLPANAYYQVVLSNDSYFNDFHYWTFTKTANLGTSSARQFPDRLPTGLYSWQIRIVNGNNEYAPPITDWTFGGTNEIAVP